MKIRVKAFLTLRKAMNDRASLEIEAERLTLKELLEKLALRFGDEFANSIRDPQIEPEDRNIQILVNGRHYRHLPDKLDAELQDGDEVSLFPFVAGG
jgi:MoaD family protein